MSLSSNVSSLATRVATEFKTVRLQLTGNNQGDLSGLQTADKSSLVAAINELVQTGGGAGDLIDDSTPSSSTTYSSNKIESMVGDVADDVSGLSGTVSSLSGQVSSLSSAVANKPDIDDEEPSTSTVYSSSETEARIQAAIDALVDGAPGALDTLKEIADALAEDDDAISSLISQVGEKVSYTEQSLTSDQQAQARANIDAAKATGDDGMGAVQDYVSVFEAGLDEEAGQDE